MFDSTGSKAIGLILLIAFLVLLIGVGPIITIWSLNTLFGLTILYNFKTWFATAWLGSFLTAYKFRNKS